MDFFSKPPIATLMKDGVEYRAAAQKGAEGYVIAEFSISGQETFTTTTHSNLLLLASEKGIKKKPAGKGVKKRPASVMESEGEDEDEVGEDKVVESTPTFDADSDDDIAAKVAAETEAEVKPKKKTKKVVRRKKVTLEH